LPAGEDISKAAKADALNIISDDEDDDDDENDADVEAEDNDSDFLSTTYTWNLRNVPKLRVNDADGVCNLTLSPQLESEPEHNAIDTSKVPMPTLTSTTQLSMEAPPTTTATTTMTTVESPSQKVKPIIVTSH